MKREMTSLNVYANEDGQIVVRQDRFGTDDSFIYFPPAQAQLLSKWIEEVAAEIEEESEYQPESGAEDRT